MKLVIVLLTTCLMQVSAATFAQKLTFSKKGATLEQIFTEIKKQTGYNVVYSSKQLDDSKTLDVNFKNTALKDVLELLEKKQGIEYSLDDLNISIKPKEPSFLERLVNRWNRIDVNGKVVDENGRPIIGATIQSKTTNRSTISDAGGNFILKDIEDGSVLIISVIGYEKKEVSAKKSLGIIRMVVTTNPLDEVRVVAYGATSNRLTVGNSGGIKATEIEKHPVQNVLAALQGQVAGIDIQQRSGVPGAGFRVTIQGRNSIQSGGDPLYVVDGIPYIAQLSSLGLNEGITGSSDAGVGVSGAPGNPLNYLDPSQIESIEVLKDASATSIYGSRGANGVILITTKKGKPGATKVDADIRQGWATVANRVNLLNTQQYIAMRKEAFKNNNIALTASNAYDILGLYGWDISRTVDWQDKLLGGTAHDFAPQLNISGGTAKTQYLIGFGYRRHTTVTSGDFSDKRGSLNLNLSTASSDDRFRLQANINSMVDNNQLQVEDLVTAALRLPPTAPEIYNPDGSLNWAYDAGGNTTWPSGNPLAVLERRYRNRATNIISSLGLTYQLLRGLDLRLKSGYNYFQNTEVQTSPNTYYDPNVWIYVTRSAQYADANISSFNIEPQLAYDRKLGPGFFSGLLGYTIYQESREANKFTGRGHNSDALLFDKRSALTMTVDGTENSVYKYDAIFGRFNYRIKDRYLLELSGRRDGSSRFGPESRYHLFYSIGGGWIFSEEDLIKNSLPFLSFGKIKVSYGTTGNDQVGNYSFLDLYVPNTGVVPYQSTTSFTVNQLYNPYLHWELTKKFNLGLDLAFVKEKVLLSVNYIRNTSSDLIFDYGVPSTVGFGVIKTNLNAEIANKSWEFSVQAKLLDTDFKWSLNANWTLPSSKLLRFEGLETSSLSSTYSIGQPVGAVFNLHFLGLNPLTGRPVYQDVNGNPTENPVLNLDGVKIAGQTLGFGGLSNSFSYKGLQLSFQLRVVNRYTTEYIALPSLGNPGRLGINQPVTVLDSRWQKPGDQAAIPAFVTTLSSYQSTLASSDMGRVNNWFVRFKNVSLSYQLAQKWSKKIGASRIALYSNIENLGFWSKSKLVGFDPETGYTSIPMLFTVTAGVKAQF